MILSERVGGATCRVNLAGTGACEKPAKALYSRSGDETRSEVMKTGYVLLGAAALVAIAGALAGRAIDTSPVMRDSAGGTLPSAPVVTAADQGLRTARSTPDHYAMVTPDGRVEVAEIALRGKMRQARARPMPPGYGYDPARDLQPYSEAELSRLTREEALIAYTSRPPTDRTAASGVAADPHLPEAQATPAQPDEGVAEPARKSIGNAKVVDVDAALADRD